MKKYTITFLCVLLVTSMLVGAAGYGISELLLKPLGIHRQEHPMALPFVLLEDEMLQFQIHRNWEKAHTPETEPPETEVPETKAPTEVPATTVPETEAPTEVPATTVAPETEPVYQAVDESWFDDALFIGDSRSFGLKGMGRLGEADYFCAASLTVFSAVTANLRDWYFPECSLEYLLKNNTYGKVYIHLGLNELSMGTEAVMEGYMVIIDMIREHQPDAIIVIQECMTMTEWMGKQDDFTIEEFRKLNTTLRELAESDPELYRFCPTNDWAAGEDGYIRPEIACDGCHLYGMYYADWAQFILEHAGWYGIE